MWIKPELFQLKAVSAPSEPERLLPELVRERFGMMPSALRIVSRAVDARRGTPMLVYSLLLEFPQLPRSGGNWTLVDEAELVRLEHPDPGLPDCVRPPESPLVVGTGPCGIFAALGLALAGCRPIIVDRGFPVERRERDYREFLQSRILNPESNLLIGEGGAGTFSDGKLYTGTRDPRAAFILKTFAEAGAPADILFLKRPHIGSDYLGRVAAGLRRKLEELGAVFQFGTEVTGLLTEGGRCRGVVTVRGERLEAPLTVLATGLGARDLNRNLRRAGVAHEFKGFQIGCRVEHPQRFVDLRQYRLNTRPAALEAAEYHLASRPRGPETPQVSTFCMCPGGETVMASAWEGRSVSNGMSGHARDGEFANSALIVTLRPERFSAPDEAFALLEQLEREAFRRGGGDYAFPAQDAAGFLRGELRLRNRRGSAAVGLRAARLDDFFLPEMRDGISWALRDFDRRFPGFIREGKLIGVESCVSSPVRFRRDPETLASSLPGLYIGGEGAGCAGGIMSAAADGLRLAAAILANA